MEGVHICQWKDKAERRRHSPGMHSARHGMDWNGMEYLDPCQNRQAPPGRRAEAQTNELGISRADDALHCKNNLAAARIITAVVRAHRTTRA